MAGYAPLLAALLAAACGSGDGSAAQTASPSPRPPGAAPAGPSSTAAPAQRRGVRLQRIGDFAQPLYVTAPPDDARRVFVVEQGGRIMVVRGGRKLAQPFLDLSARTEAAGEQGLLGLAFAPDYATSGRFYVHYTDNAGDTRVVEYRRATEDRAAPGSARQVLFQDQPEVNHNGGQLAFGPDGLLYIGLGDGGGGGDQHGARGNGQSLGTLLGKILRIDPRPSGGRAYRVPRSNPFVGRRGARGEIYAYGLRNPWRFSFDRQTGDLVIGDVGQDAWEEINFVRRGHGKGANFGWRPFEGRARHVQGESAPGHVPPVIVRSHDEGWCSITGGVVVRDPELAGLRGRYVFGDYCQGRVVAARLSAGRARAVRGTRLHIPGLSSFGEDSRGRVYATSLSGPVYRLAPR
jgi:glucose/arabinose dehydrogenase